MAYKKVVEMLGERLASVLELLKKWLIDWSLDTDKLLHFAHQVRKEDLLGLLEGTHKVVRIEKGKLQQEVGTLSATIDLDANPSLPFNGATIEKHKKGGKVTIEKRADGLYIDGHKVVLHLSERQVNGKTIQGHELRRELDGKPVLNAGVLDFLMANQSFVPDEMKKDAKGNTVYTFFWGTIYRSSDGYLVVRFCYWHVGRLKQYYSWLGFKWKFHSPAACLAK